MNSNTPLRITTLHTTKICTSIIARRLLFLRQNAVPCHDRPCATDGRYYREENEFTKKPDTYHGKLGWFTEEENGQWIAEQSENKEAADKEAADKEAADKEAADKEAADKGAVSGTTIQNAALSAGTPRAAPKGGITPKDLTPKGGLTPFTTPSSGYGSLSNARRTAAAAADAMPPPAHQHHGHQSQDSTPR
ncbi:hypothetical protein E2P81_ATG02884 [Venturia nashicola]|uniref:Uncharacterized protein n=1 Tax=Venturia nashicola TaxID=86259 RepID=A0A4Z1PLD1_9PEZI|nr:hypothetical protein E6O75_ATG02948 [Venturia nashicola]TLD35995.1 hypothetical protein E2P81_ATG02884 [Venturia nashicola]